MIWTTLKTVPKAIPSLHKKDLPEAVCLKKLWSLCLLTKAWIFQVTQTAWYDDRLFFAAFLSLQSKLTSSFLPCQVGQEDETLLQEGAALEQAIMQGEETTTATVTAVIGEGDAAVALALTTDANGDVVKQIMLTDGTVLGICNSNGELSLSEGVNLLQQEDGSAALHFIQGNIQVPLETVRALFTME